MQTKFKKRKVSQTARGIFAQKWLLCKAYVMYGIWVKLFKNGPGKICGRQSLKNSKWYGLPKQTMSLHIF